MYRRDIGGYKAKLRDIESEIIEICAIASKPATELELVSLASFLAQQYPDHLSAFRALPRAVVAAHEALKTLRWEEVGGQYNQGNIPQDEREAFKWWRDCRDHQLCERSVRERREFAEGLLETQRDRRLDRAEKSQAAARASELVASINPYGFLDEMNLGGLVNHNGMGGMRLDDVGAGSLINVGGSGGQAWRKDDELDINFDDLSDDGKSDGSSVASEDSEASLSPVEDLVPAIVEFIRPVSNRTLEELLEDDEVWNYSQVERQRIARYWADEVIDEAGSFYQAQFKLWLDSMTDLTLFLWPVPLLATLRSRQQSIAEKIKSFKNQSKLETLKKADIIGCTTNG
jgi:hypothetical protein